MCGIRWRDCIASFALVYVITFFYSKHLDTYKSGKLPVAVDCKTAMTDDRETDSTENSLAKLCELCEEETIDVKFIPCGHEVLCSLCAHRAVRCLLCRV